MNVPFEVRLCALLLLLAAVALWDYRRRGDAATKWREYGFLVVAAILGGAIGVGADSLTSRLSPEYFVRFKGIEPGDGFYGRVLALGFHAGFLAGAVAGMCVLLANNPKPTYPPLTYGQLFRSLWRPVAAAIACAALYGVALAPVVPTTAFDEFTSGLSLSAEAWLVRVWCVHFGLYFGATAGVVWVVAHFRSQRRAAMTQ